MARLEFFFRDIAAEIDAVSKATEAFIAPSSVYVLPQLKGTLDEIRRSPSGRSYPWSIAQASPLCTRTSFGDYERDSGGQHCVFAMISSIWEIEPLGPHNPNSWPHRKFALTGLASTMVRICDGSFEEQGAQMAMWRMEVGDEESPGCHFHVQVLGEKDELPFPHSLPVPRFPCLFLTPMAILEFVLGELFQDEWRKHAASETSQMQRWQTIQRERLSKLLRWKVEQVERLPGPAWMILKSAKPPADLFL